MNKKVSSVEKLRPLNIPLYELFTDDSQNQEIVVKLNSMVQRLNESGHITNKVVSYWNQVIDWVLNEGLTESTNKKIDEYIQNGTFDVILEQLVTEKSGELEAILTDLRENGTGIDSFAREELAGVTLQLTQTDEKISMLPKEVDKLALFFWKLRNKQPVSITCMGDSMTYGSDFNSSDKLLPTGGADDGTPHVATRAKMNYPASLENYLNQVYGNTVTVVNHGFSGDGTKKGYNHWNASGSDLCIICYGINDATNANVDYMGNVEEYLHWYRKIIERELKNNTAVVLMTPTKQIITSDGGVASRVDVDVFGNAVRNLADEYGLKVIDGQELLMNYSASIYSDSTHLNGTGYNILGARIASLFVGRGILKPFIVSTEQFQGVIPYQHSTIYQGGNVVFSSYYPTPSEHIEGRGAGALLKTGDKLFFSIYTENDGMVVIPSMFSDSVNLTVRLSLDFGVPQADYSNDYYFGRPSISGVDVEYSNSFVDIEKSKFLSDGIFSSKFIKPTKDNMLYIPTKGWHTITLEVVNVDNTITVHGLEYFLHTRMSDRFGDKVIYPTLESGVTNFYSYPLSVKKTVDNLVVINGVLNTIPTDRPTVLTIIPTEYRPSVNTAFIVPLSTSTSGGYGVISVQSSGEVRLVYTSSDVAYCALNGIIYQVAN